MARNPFFDFYTNINEQNLLEDLTVEGIRFKAPEVVYLPRNVDVNDDMLNETVITSYNYAIDVEMAIENIHSFQGEGQLLSKFGLEVNDQMTLTLTKRTFNEFIQPYTKKERPWEGDCIYIPMTNNIYKIKFADSTPNFYLLGKSPVWEITAELLQFSGEKFNTGREEIDSLNKPFMHADDPDYSVESYDPQARNQVIQDESDKILDFSEMNPFVLGEE